MTIFSPILLFIVSSLIYTITSASGCDDSCFLMHQYLKQADQKFEQRTNKFWEFKEESNSWVEVKLPYDLVSCINGSCKVVNSIQKPIEKTENHQKDRNFDVSDQRDSSSYSFVPVRKRVSLTRMSETSIWVTGISGAIYERFWNGLQWVIAPHELPISAGYAVSVFIVNQTILALSESGLLYQMQVTEESQPIWIEFMPEFDHDQAARTVQNSAIRISSGVLSDDGERIYFCTKNGSLLELNGIDPPRWTSHGRPPGANVAAIADAATIRSAVLFTLSVAGDLYEYEETSKPPWKKHIHNKGTEKDISLAPVKGCSLLGLHGAHSASLFLLTKRGELVERRLNQRKWKWMVHGNPKGHPFASVACVSQDEQNDNSNSLFLTTATGFVFEYQISKHHPGSIQEQETEEKWLNHKHPPHTRVARGIPGLQMQVGRIIFPLDDGRLAELHLSGFGGENFGPCSQISTKRKSLLKYVWSTYEAPESEGWNAEYCTEERGPSNCMLGTKGEASEVANTKSASKWRKDTKTQQNYLCMDSLSSSREEYNINSDKRINSYFRLRLMQEGKSFFLVTDNGVTFEYLNTENVWFWLKHEHVTKIEGVVGNYNGILFLVDEFGSLLIRERSSSDLAWTNCTAMRKGRQVIGGPPWDGAPGRERIRKPEDDAIFFVSRSGRLLQFTVGMRKFKWKDCKNPPSTKIACIADQEGFRENVVFVIGRNGRLYQYNKVTELWHEHYQSQHLVLSTSPGTAIRFSTRSTKGGSLFMLSENGGLVEYQWRSFDGWNWIEHGTPYANVTLVGSPGPCFGEGELFLIGSDGNVYLRFLDQGEWKWRDCGFPYQEYDKVEDEEVNKKCDPKVSSTRPIPFSGDTVAFELRDGRLGEMRRMEDKYWIWWRTIGTPTSTCMTNFWTSLAS